MFETVKDLWHDYVCLHQSERTKIAMKGVRQATEKFDAANLKLEGAMMHLILNGNGKDHVVEKHVKPNGATTVKDERQIL